MCKLRVKHWSSFTVHGNPMVAQMDKYDVGELLREIRDQVPAGKPLSLMAAYDLYMHTISELLYEEGGGKRAAVLANQGFVSAVQSLGYRIVINGSEFEPAPLA